MNLDGQVIFQIYRGAIQGNQAFALSHYADTIAKMGHGAICFHGFPRELAGAWDQMAQIASDAGLSAIASWGLDGERDNDGSPLTGAEKGDLMGDVLSRPTCSAGLEDAEGHWDAHDGPGDVTDEDDALALGEALRKRAPTALVGDQLWFAILSHASIRKTPLPADPLNVMAGFPADEFARRSVNWYRFREAYCNEAGFKRQWGSRRYEEVFAWMDRDWAIARVALANVGLDRPLGVTIQGYGWSTDCLDDLAHCLLKYRAQLQQPVVIWGEPFPDDDTLRYVVGTQKLIDHGFAGPGVDPFDAIRAYQSDWNKSAPSSQQLVVDGRCGPKTIATLVSFP